MKGVDYAWGRPGLAALLAAGAHFACRYLSYNTTGKNLTRAEADRLRAAGIDPVSNWEAAGSWPEFSGGAATGARHAREAARQHTACGGPGTRPVYFSTDFNPVSLAAAVKPRHRALRTAEPFDDATYAHALGRMHPDQPGWNVLSPQERAAAEDHIAANTEPLAGQLSTIADYYRGVNGVMGLARDGAYGGKKTISYLFDAGVITYGWQTYAWSAGVWDPRAQLRQTQNGVIIGGVDCDLDSSMQADFGQWSWTTGGTDVNLTDTIVIDGETKTVKDVLHDGWAFGWKGKGPFAEELRGAIAAAAAPSQAQVDAAVAVVMNDPEWMAKLAAAFAAHVHVS